MEKRKYINIAVLTTKNPISEVHFVEPKKTGRKKKKMVEKVKIEKMGDSVEVIIE